MTVPAEMVEKVARRFAARAVAVDGADGFEGFDLLRPSIANSYSRATVIVGDR
jgi:heme oxygenase (mycobilin-producing)